MFIYLQSSNDNKMWRFLCATLFLTMPFSRQSAPWSSPALLCCKGAGVIQSLFLDSGRMFEFSYISSNLSCFGGGSSPGFERSREPTRVPVVGL